MTTKLRLRQIRQGDSLNDQLTAGQVAAVPGAATTQEDVQDGLLSQVKRIVWGGSAGAWEADFRATQIPSLLSGYYDFLLDCDPDATTHTNTITRTAGRVTNETWVSSVTLLAVKSNDYTRALDRVVTEVVKVFGANGVTVVAQKTLTYSRAADRVVTISSVRDI